MKKGDLYLIPTSIGIGTEDQTLSKQSKNTIKNIDIFIVENIRTARRFIRRIDRTRNIDNILFYSHGKHSSIDLQEDFLGNILKGQDIGIISEAGSPCVADPGSDIVNFAHKFQIKVVPVVGPSSILLALMASGLNGQNFAFVGYLPIKKKETEHKMKQLEYLSQKNGQTQIFIETPYRNLQLFESILRTCNMSTKLCIASNITLEEEYIRTKTIKEWKEDTPKINKQATVFLLSC